MQTPNDNMTTQMRKGMLEYCVLLILSRGMAYASDISAILQRHNMIVVEATLYTLLTRLRREGKLDYTWMESPKGPPRKYYSISELGQETLEQLNRAWTDLKRTVDDLKNLHNGPGASETPVVVEVIEATESPRKPDAAGASTAPGEPNSTAESKDNYIDPELII